MSVIEEIKKRISIQDLIGRLGLEVRRGFIFSPFRSEKTPSCKVYFDKNSFYDFSVMEGGDVIDLYCAVQSVDKKKAISDLSGMYGLLDTHAQARYSETRGIYSGNGDERTSVPDAEASVLGEREPVHGLVGLMSEVEVELYYERVGMASVEEALKEVRLYRLKKNIEIFIEFENYCRRAGWDVKAFHYLRDQRKMSEALIDKYMFCVCNYMQLNNHMKKSFPPEDLKRSGLFNCKPGSDGSMKSNLIFAFHRIMIPYYSVVPGVDGVKCVYMRARYFDNAGSSKPEGGNKYSALRDDGLGVNMARRFYFPISPLDTLRYPGSVLGDMRGEGLAMHGLMKRLYITEGEMDAMVIKEMLHYNAMAIPGAGNIPPIEKFSRLMQYECISCIDNDAAGQKLLTGHWIDKNGKPKYSEQNLTAFFKHYNRNLVIKEIPTKDINDWVVEQLRG